MFIPFVGDNPQKSRVYAAPGCYNSKVEAFCGMLAGHFYMPSQNLLLLLVFHDRQLRAKGVKPLARIILRKVATELAFFVFVP